MNDDDRTISRDDDRTISRDELERLGRAAAQPAQFVLHIDGSSPHEVSRRVVVGRNPEGGDGVDVLTISGDALVSKSHMAFDLSHEGLIAIDLGSSNGSSVALAGLTSALSTEEWTTVEPGSVVSVGDTAIRVESPAPVTGVPVPAATTFAIASDLITVVPSPTGAQDPPTCPSCGREVVAGARFCDGCGSAIGVDAPPPPAAPAPPGPPTTRPWSDDLVDPAAGVAASGSPGNESKSRRPVILAAVGVIAVIAAAVIGWLIFGGGGGDELSATPLPRVADGVEERWSVDIDGAQAVTGSASALFVFAIDDEDAEVVALDGGSGDERWIVDVGRNVSFGGLIGVLDGVVLGETCDFDGECEAFGIETSSGEVLWTDEWDGDGYLSASGTLLVQESDSLELIDARDGSRVERIRSDSISVDGDHVYAREDDEIEVFDTEDLSSVFGPVDVDDDARGAVYRSGELITALEDELIVIDGNGDVDRESRVPADEIFRIIRGPNGMVIVSTDDGVFGLEPVDGRAEEIWSVDGSLSFGFVSDIGPVVIVYEDADAELLDARTGDTLLDLRDYFESDQRIGSNGLINLVYDADVEATALRYSDGEEIWDDDFDGFVTLVDNGLVEIDEDEVRFFR